MPCFHHLYYFFSPGDYTGKKKKEVGSLSFINFKDYFINPLYI